MNLEALQALGAVSQPAAAIHIPLEWIHLFGDMAVAFVLAAHAAAVPDAEPHTFIQISERDLARQCLLDRETLRAKKRFLIQQGILEPIVTAIRGVARACRVNWQRLRELVEKRTGFRPPVDGIPPTQNRPVEGIPPTSDRPVDGKPPTSPPPSLTLSSLANELKLASTSTEQTEENPNRNALKEAVVFTIHGARLFALDGKALDPWTVQNLCRHLERIDSSADGGQQVREILDVLAERSSFLAKHPHNGKNWGYIVGLVRSEVNNRGGQPERKPAQTAELFGEVKALAAKMGSRR